MDVSCKRGADQEVKKVDLGNKEIIQGVGNYLFAWIVLHVEKVTTNSAIFWQHFKILISKWLAVFPLVDVTDTVTLFKGSSDSLEGSRTDPLFTKHGVLSVVQLLTIGVVNGVEGNILRSGVVF